MNEIFMDWFYFLFPTFGMSNIIVSSIAFLHMGENVWRNLIWSIKRPCSHFKINKVLVDAFFDILLLKVSKITIHIHICWINWVECAELSRFTLSECTELFSRNVET